LILLTKVIKACYAVEFSKFTFAWQLNSNAVLMCQALGYHRLPVDDSESSAINDKKSALFWFSYMMDKGLSLRFGRSSLIQDYDVTMPRRLGRQLNISDFWKEMLNLWIWHAEATGKVYEQLYSPTALTKPIEERVECALRLIDTIKGIARENDELIRLAKKRNSLPADHPGMPGYTMDLMLKSDEVTYWGALALVYRAIPATPGLGSTFNPECIHAAQKAMEVHLECMAMAGDDKYTTAGYLHWLVANDLPHPNCFLYCVPFTNPLHQREQDHLVCPVHPVYRLVLPHHRDFRPKVPRVDQPICRDIRARMSHVGGHREALPRLPVASECRSSVSRGQGAAGSEPGHEPGRQRL